MSLPLCKKDSTLTVTNPTSIPYIDLTLETLDFFGIKIDKSVSEAKIVFTIPGKQHYSPVDMTLEGDWSSASNFFVIGALFGDLLIKGLNINSLQADKAILSVVKNCGADIILEKNGIRVRRSHLIPFEYDATNSPDLFPSLAIMASLIEGESVITGIDRLRNKESNRTDAIFTNLSNMGVSVSLNADSMIINGISPARRVVESRLLKGGSYSSYNDHRIAMMLKIASLCCDGKVVIDQVECIEKSFPLFNELFNSIITLKKK
jgi:3-phosphoshikimate 1-carboxyvinyltransferase